MSHLLRPDPLPVEEVAGAFKAAITSTPVVVLSSPPGSGKTTMAPLFLRQALPRGDIWVVQPRRIAAVMAAHQIARTISQPVGQEVGYHIRFESVASAATRIRCMTDGVMVRRLVEPRVTEQVAAIILDEFHERSLAMDVAAWWFRSALSDARGSIPRLVILSATLERARLESYFPELVWIEARGLSHPVTTHWGPEHDTRSLEDQVVAAVRRAAQDTDGSILCFLPTVRSIEECLRRVASLRELPGFEFFALHGGLSVEEQQRVVRRSQRRRIIFSTNIAESSLTVEGVACVIDSGLARLHRPSSSGESRLSVERVSQAACVQRAGRAGREGPGVVYRLYPAVDFSLRREAELPEVRTKETTSLLLWQGVLKGEGQGATPLIDEPHPAAVMLGQKLLSLWGLMSSDGALTEQGRAVSLLPVEPRIGAFLLFAREEAVARRDGGDGSGSEEMTLAIWTAVVLSGDPGGASRHLLLQSESSAERVNGEKRRDRQSEAVHNSEPDECDLLAAIESIRRSHRADLSRLFEQIQSSVTARLTARKVKQTDNTVPRRGGVYRSADCLVRALVRAFPDRVAVRRHETDEYLFATGDRAVLSRSSRARSARFIVATDWWSGETRPGAPGIIITRATPIEEELLFDLYPALLSSHTCFEWNDEAARVDRVSETRFWAAPIERVCNPAPEGDEEGQRVLGSELCRRGARWILEGDTLQTLLGRLTLATGSGGPFAGISLSADELAQWIAAFPHRAVSHRQLTAWIQQGGLSAVLSHHLGYQWREVLAGWCPETIPLPGRARTPITYEPGHQPSVASRIQDFFGASTLPHIAGGTQPLRIHLLAPNGRTVQVTDNLSSFWSVHYPTLRRQLQSRYPRHRWPEDPTQPCPPTQRGASKG